MIKIPGPSGNGTFVVRMNLFTDASYTTISNHSVFAPTDLLYVQVQHLFRYLDQRCRSFLADWLILLNPMIPQVDADYFPDLVLPFFEINLRVSFKTAFFQSNLKWTEFLHINRKLHLLCFKQHQMNGIFK